MKFPKRIRHKGQTVTIYGKSKSYRGYRVAWHVAGQRKLERFRTYSEAKTRADKLVKDLAKGSHVTALSAKQAADALASYERLQAYFQRTGHSVSLLRAVSEWVEASGKVLPLGKTVGEAIDGYTGSVAMVKRYDLLQAVNDFITAEEPRTKLVDGQRPQLSPRYAYNRAIMLRRLASAFPGHAVCDLSKALLDTFIGSKELTEFSPKSRNHYRAAIKQFLQWSVRKDFLPVTHRLNEADSMRPEHANSAEVEFYTPHELRKLLTAADGSMRAMIAIGGIAGLRTSELMRLTWDDVWRVRGHIEVTAGKAKTRQRRLVQVCPALASWLRLYRDNKTGAVCDITDKSAEVIWQQRFVALCDAAEVKRKANGLRHAFCSYHFALHGNENLTAQQAGNSPAMIHQHYKGLATKAEGKKWFTVAPPKAANVIELQARATL